MTNVAGPDVAAHRSTDERFQMPESTPDVGSGPDVTELEVVANSAAHAATISIIECLAKITEHARRNPYDTQLPSSSEVMRELRRCVSSYVVCLRDLDTPPEGAVVVIKRMLANSLRAPEPLRGSITDAVVPWVVEAYFPPSEAS